MMPGGASRIFLINSGAYISEGLRSEYGKIPPVFLPLQGKSLLNHQLDSIPAGAEIFLTLPEDFDLSLAQKRLIFSYDVEVVYTDVKYSLGFAIALTILNAARTNATLNMLHGDTYFRVIPDDEDIYSISLYQDNYGWAKSLSDSKYAISGYFSFSDQALLLKTLAENKFDFVKSLKSYITVKGMSEIELKDWFDFGHVNTFYRSKARLTTERVFNNLIIDAFAVNKFGSDINKLRSELQWFNQVPTGIKKYTPKVLDYEERSRDYSYSIEYYYLSTLAELYLYARQDQIVWDKILKSCFGFLSKCLEYKPREFPYSRTEEFYLFEKSRKRLEKFAIDNGFDLQHPIRINDILLPSINDLLEEINQCITPLGHLYLGVSHGDFCFSNIFYDFKSNSIRVIDPRGLLPNGNQTIYGDVTYDILKLGHSAVGYYDFIVSGQYDLEVNNKYDFRFSLFIDERFDVVRPIFLDLLQEFDARLAKEFYPRLIHLFLSMLPLHSDNQERQFALLVNAYRIFSLHKKNNLQC